MAGKVKDGDGEPIEGAEIMMVVGGNGSAFGSTLSDAEGHYRLGDALMRAFLFEEARNHLQLAIDTGGETYQEYAGERLAERRMPGLGAALPLRDGQVPLAFPPDHLRARHAEPRSNRDHAAGLRLGSRKRVACRAPGRSG